MRAYVVPRIGHFRLDRLSPMDVQTLYPSYRARVLRVESPCPALKSETSVGSSTTPSASYVSPEYTWAL